ncbi:MAG: acyl-CoA thioesterase [Pseudobdellovibrionaceae bacterium]
MAGSQIREIACEQKLTHELDAPEESRNPLGDVFGGWLLSHMDIAGGARAAEAAQGRVVTVAVDRMVFEKPVFVNDRVRLYTEVERIGTTSISILVTVKVIRAETGEVEQNAAHGTFTFVAIDERKQPRPVRA